MNQACIYPKLAKTPSHFGCHACSAPDPKPECQTQIKDPCDSPLNKLQLTRPLVLGGAGLGELEDDTTAGEALVNLGVGVESVVNTTALLLVKDDLEGLGAVLFGADTLADDLDGVDEVGQDSIVDSGKSAGTGTLLLLEVAGAGGALGAGENAASSEDEDVAVGELLLELTGQAGWPSQQQCCC